jgi:hypothetical protein
MREILAGMEGQRITVRGVFRRMGRKRDAGGATAPFTVLLTPVLLLDGTVVADHMWFSFTSGFRALTLRPGVVVELTGRVTRYRKGAQIWERATDQPIFEDFRISRPTHLRIVGGEAPAEADDPRAALLTRVRAGESATSAAITAVLSLYRGDRPTWHYGNVLIARGQLAIVERALLDLRTMLDRAPA